MNNKELIVQWSLQGEKLKQTQLLIQKIFVLQHIEPTLRSRNSFIFRTHKMVKNTFQILHDQQVHCVSEIYIFHTSLH